MVGKHQESNEKITIGKGEIDITLAYLPSSEELVKNQQALPEGGGALSSGGWRMKRFFVSRSGLMPLSLLGIQLLGFTQRIIHASKRHIQVNRRPRKAFPISVKTLGDLIQAKRFEKGLCQSELAEKVGIPMLLVRQWEENQQIPTEAQWQLIRSQLKLTAQLPQQ